MLYTSWYKIYIIHSSEYSYNIWYTNLTNSIIHLSHSPQVHCVNSEIGLFSSLFTCKAPLCPVWPNWTMGHTVVVRQIFTSAGIAGLGQYWLQWIGENYINDPVLMERGPTIWSQCVTCSKAIVDLMLEWMHQFVLVVIDIAWYIQKSLSRYISNNTFNVDGWCIYIVYHIQSYC